MKAPDWLEGLVAEVCRDEDVRRPLRVDVWRASPATREWSTGHTHWQRFDLTCDEPAWISLTFGTKEVDRKLVTLHELAHHVHREQTEPRLFRRQDAHGTQFWRVAWRLYVRYGMEEAALKSESKYVKLSVSVALQEGVAGAAKYASVVAPKAQPTLTIQAGTRVRCRGGRTGTVIRPLWSRYAIRMDDDGREWRWPAVSVEVM